LALLDEVEDDWQRSLLRFTSKKLSFEDEDGEVDSDSSDDDDKQYDDDDDEEDDE
jgi:hypothetical protein